MGLLVNGEWETIDSHPDAKGIRNFITRDGSSDYKAEPGRYYLYLAMPCPFSHRTLIMRKLKSLEETIGLIFVSPLKNDQSWEFSEENPDPLNNFQRLHQVYTLSDNHFTGSVSVPVLYDSFTHKIVSNDSGDIMLMLNNEFEQSNPIDYCPSQLKNEINEMNEFLLLINIGVYKVGLANNQDLYEAEVDKLFEAIDRVEGILENQRYLLGDQITISDWRLFVTLMRFDCVYFGLMKCNIRSIESYENISNYLRELYQIPGIAETVDVETYKKGYYHSFVNLNPFRITPKGPIIDYSRPHNRNKFST